MNTPATPLPRASLVVIEQRLREGLQPEQLEIQDDSAQHAGHAGAREGGHYTVRVVSERFRGLTRVARHRLVYDLMAELMRQGIHALVIDAKAPGEP
ncbi:BolA family transcriptional regulator [Mitsuaria sp. WAJ17]|uniref:BolA family protein n=1 Tax=Mitsuaria sp. WAJ17 TaxID=2761452 RepID=UPI0016035FCB|nr:BolA family protein [Mitsuaria sp. WAJ17]MBB2485989.1 BolA family transcriptional regulator [Mitsuaria sp. WAJ17]